MFKDKKSIANIQDRVKCKGTIQNDPRNNKHHEARKHQDVTDINNKLFIYGFGFFHFFQSILKCLIIKMIS